MKDEREYGLVLAGGGTKGAYQVGMWKALKELNINIKAIVGASIGSLNGALILQDNFKQMEELYNNIKITDIMDVGDEIDIEKNIFNVSNITKMAVDFTEQKGISNEPLRKTINKYIDMDKLYNSEIDFGLMTVKAKDLSPVPLFKNEIKKEEMTDYLLASSCFPIFKPQKIGNEEYLDGGLYDNIPINMLLEKGYKNIIVGDIAGVGLKRKMIDKNVYLKVISPNESLGGTFEFNHERIKNNIKLGYLDTMRAFNKLQGHIYYFKTSEFNKMLEQFNLQTIYGLEYSAKIYNIDRYREYEFEEFIKILNEKHKEAEKKYDKIKNSLHLKNLLELKNEINSIFDKGLGICFVTDMYLNKPMSKKFEYLKRFIQDYMQAMRSLLELENYME